MCIDLKSFFASVECVERGLDPIKTNLVVADEGRTEKTICLAVTPSLKKYGISGRARLFEVIEKVKEINLQRLKVAPEHKFIGKSTHEKQLDTNPSLELDYIVAAPRMAYYIDYSKKIYNIYLRYFSPDDIHVYSIDEVFIDTSSYLEAYGVTAPELAKSIILDILSQTGITATAGIGTNLYLAKIAMDIHAKKIKPDKDGVRIAQLDELSYRKNLWGHTPIRDFWRIGRGYAEKLAQYGMYTMGDVARCSLGNGGDFRNEELLYKLFGVNAELLIDHAWGYEPCTMADIKAYKPSTTGMSSGQVLSEPYSFEKARIIVKEMAEGVALELVEKGLVTKQLTLTIIYDVSNVTKDFKGETASDYLGRKVPKPSHSTANLERKTASSKLITDALCRLYDKIADKKLCVRKLAISVDDIVPKEQAEENNKCIQLDLFTSNDDITNTQTELERENKVQNAVVTIKKKYGKNAVLKGTSLQEGATAIQRNGQIGGHKA